MSDNSFKKEGYEPAAYVPKIIINPTEEKFLNGNRPWQGVPSISMDKKSGRLWCVFFSGGNGEGPGNFLVLFTSDNGGKSWVGPKMAVDSGDPPALRVYDGNLWSAPDGKMWLFFSQTYEYFDGIGGVWATYTENPNSETPDWSTPQRIANGTAINKPIVLSNGDWMISTYIWDMYAKYDPPENKLFANHYADELGSEINANVYISRDKGATWEYHGSVPSYEAEKKGDMNDFSESMLVEKKDGTLSMLIRTHLGIEQSNSDNGGKTWSPSKYAGICNVASRFHIKRLSSGRMLLVFNNPPDGGTVRSHLTAALSDDDGATWKYKLLLDERENSTYPDAVEANDGTLYISYDCGRHRNGNILMAKICEEDIMAEKIVCKNSALKMLINDNT